MKWLKEYGKRARSLKAMLEKKPSKVEIYRSGKVLGKTKYLSQREARRPVLKRKFTIMKIKR